MKKREPLKKIALLLFSIISTIIIAFILYKAIKNFSDAFEYVSLITGLLIFILGQIIMSVIGKMGLNAYMLLFLGYTKLLKIETDENITLKYLWIPSIGFHCFHLVPIISLIIFFFFG